LRASDAREAACIAARNPCSRSTARKPPSCDSARMKSMALILSASRITRVTVLMIEILFFASVELAQG
jgi:hypothetical protein